MIIYLKYEQPIAQTAQNTFQGGKHMKFKKIPAAALAVVTAAGLAACSGSSSGADDAVGIRVWGAEDDQALLSELIAGFEAQYPDVDFDIQLGVESESTAKDTILTDVEAPARLR